MCLIINKDILLSREKWRFSNTKTVFPGVVKIEINTLKCDLTMVQVKVFKKSFLIYDKIVN